MSGKFLLGNMLSSIVNKRPLDVTPVIAEYSGLCYGVLSVLKNAGYVKSFRKIDGKIPVLEIFPTIQDGKKTISKMKLYSTPGCRSYVTIEQVKALLARNKYKTYIVSTSQGIMSGFEANKLSIGGEFLCEVF